MDLTPSPYLVHALLERNQRDLYRLGAIPIARDDDDLEIAHRRAIADRLKAEIKAFEDWLSRYAAARATVQPDVGDFAS